MHTHDQRLTSNIRVKGGDTEFEELDSLVDHLLGQLDVIDESYWIWLIKARERIAAVNRFTAPDTGGINEVDYRYLFDDCPAVGEAATN